jgi:hypothetical protein
VLGGTGGGEAHQARSPAAALGDERGEARIDRGGRERGERSGGSQAVGAVLSAPSAKPAVGSEASTTAPAATVAASRLRLRLAIVLVT